MVHEFTEAEKKRYRTHGIARVLLEPNSSYNPKTVVLDLAELSGIAKPKYLWAYSSPLNPKVIIASERAPRAIVPQRYKSAFESRPSRRNFMELDVPAEGDMFGGLEITLFNIPQPVVKGEKKHYGFKSLFDISKY